MNMKVMKRQFSETDSVIRLTGKPSDERQSFMWKNYRQNQGYL
jgi:hypothetical protein